MRKLIVLSAGMIAAGTVAAQSPDLTRDQAQAKLTAAGYESVRDLKMDDGFWEADARRADGRWIDVRVHPASGKVYAEDTTAKLDAEAVGRKLTAAGYTNVRDIDFDDGVWTADARTRDGAEVDLAVDPDDGTVLVEHPDD
ncbi:PepSY domain-containing protein [Novilysobacter spongiicola]|uniref:Peptidase propeptide and YPEB domain-containing protein n=1 Tax=Lysobacter spongiicola DSM 21749 TaxID=1122188 RepID=A0A1T4QS55_9GAMM|nr:PepSY domain-containing protein [Lysobacter spongiicola]SKA06321.1 Peptidase propeptide and YPEB domain-containing protein [Lysobacter spongiicola DSM 21749]